MSEVKLSSKCFICGYELLNAVNLIGPVATYETGYETGVLAN